MQKIGAISKSPNRYQQLSIIAFAICVSVRYGIIDYPVQRYIKIRLHEIKICADELKKRLYVFFHTLIGGTWHRGWLPVLQSHPYSTTAKDRFRVRLTSKSPFQPLQSLFQPLKWTLQPLKWNIGRKERPWRPVGKRNKRPPKTFLQQECGYSADFY